MHQQTETYEEIHARVGKLKMQWSSGFAGEAVWT
jgi:hypothetical protein